MEYVARKARADQAMDLEWDGPFWSEAEAAEIGWFHPKSSDHRPEARAKVLYDDEGLYVLFDVKDRWVRATRTEYQGPVCRDSCAEFFVQPKADKGYFNFEMNCGGTLLLYYVEDPERTPEGLKKQQPVDEEWVSMMSIEHTMPKRVWPEIEEPVRWQVGYRVPRAMFEAYVGPLGDLKGQQWRGNFYKCADESSHPHWGAWSPVGEQLNFHQPEKFGVIRFA